MIALICVFALGTSLNGQTIAADQVPVPVKTTFSEIFAGAQVTSWEKVGAEIYESHFSWKERPTLAVFNGSGRWIKTVQRIRMVELPDTVIRYAKDLYPDRRLSEPTKITRPDEELMFEVKLKRGADSKSLVFTNGGALLSEEDAEKVTR